MVATPYLMVLFLVADCHAWHLDPPRGVDMRRRHVLSAVAAASWLPLSPAVAEEDVLVKRLLTARDALSAASGALKESDWDRVRKAVKDAATPLTLKGYLGDSVKARVLALEEAKEGSGRDLAADRVSLLRSLAVIDKYCYARQTGGNTDDDPASAIESSLNSLDSIVAKLQ
jgi:hypothetical protein